MDFGEIESALSLGERFLRWLKRSKPNPEASTLVSRFIHVFKQHGVHQNQIPRFFGHDLTVADMQDDQILLSKLSEGILADVCDLFVIRREWLDGASDQIHPTYDFYKKPEDFAKFIDELLLKTPDGNLSGVLVAPLEVSDDAEALLILQETIAYIGDKPIYRFYLCDNWYFSYWKARAYLTACVASAWQRTCYVHGIYKPKAFIDQLNEGKTLLGWKGEGLWALGHKNWDPEYMLYDPDLFLKGIDPEINDFGITSGLELWLELAKQGLMVTDCEPSVQRFEEKLVETNAQKVRNK